MLHELLRFEPETGLFYWRVDRSNVRAGDVAGHVHSLGYRTICVDYDVYYAHHLAWFFTHGVWPKKGGQIDHDDGNRDNNRPGNLKDTTPSLNGLNRKRPNKNNTSGVLGVSFDEQRKKFVASIMINRKCIHLGRFESIEDAVSAREKAYATFTRR